MDFEQFRILKGWTLERAAEELRVPGHERMGRIDASQVSRHERALWFPSPEMIERYAEITDNAVTFADWARLRAQGGRPKRRRGRRPKSAPA